MPSVYSTSDKFLHNSKLVSWVIIHLSIAPRRVAKQRNTMRHLRQTK